MIRIIHTSNSQPASLICDPNVEFLPGMAAQLTVVNNVVMASVSNGIAPFGIIDDIRTNAFSSVSWNEEVITPAVGVFVGDGYVTSTDIKCELKYAYINSKGFASTVPVKLNPTNGVITFIAGTKLNYDLLGLGYPNAIRTLVNYSYQIPNIPGDDTTMGSGRITVWYQRMFVQTDQFETNQVYAINDNLYVSESGLFTTRRPSDKHPAVGLVTAPPSSHHAALELLWL